MRKWRCIRAEYETLTVGKIYTTDNEGYNLINDMGKIHSCLRIQDYGYSKFEEVIGFTKSDLEECDVVVLRNGERFVYFDEHFVGSEDSIGMGWYDVDLRYDVDLTRNDGFNKYDIMEVYRNKQLIYKRDEKSASQLKVEELEKTIAKAMEQIDEIKKENGYDN